MAITRFGHLDDFTQKNNKVGIGTSTPQDKMEVIGGTRSTDLRVAGIATLTSAGGFIEKHIQYVEDQVKIDTGDSGTLSGEIVVGAGLTMTVGTAATTSQGTVDALKVYDMFQPPSGGTNQRPPAKTGAIFYNFDFKTIEFFDGNFWKQVDNTTRRGRAVFGGGYASPVVSLAFTLDVVNIPTLGNAIYFGNLNNGGSSKGSMGSNGTRGLFMGGYWPGAPSITQQIDYITIPSQGDSIDFGNLATANSWGAQGSSSSTRGIRMGGYPNTDVIEYVEIDTLGNAIDFGNLTVARHSIGTCASTTEVFGGGGNAGNDYRSVIDKIRISSLGNSIDDGDLGSPQTQVASSSNSIRGIWAGGGNPSPQVSLDDIQYRTLSSSGTTQYFGELTQKTNYAAGASTSTRAIIAGGQNPSGKFNTITFITIATAGNAQDFGDLSLNRSALAGCSDSHGGLGGF